jgi:glutamate:GABA antiporter
MTDAPAVPDSALPPSERGKLVRSLGRLDMVLFTVCAFVALDTLGVVASAGPEGFTWLIVLAAAFVVPYALLMAEVGSAFTQEGGPYQWVRLAFGRGHAAVAAVMYWVTNPLWVGGSLAFIATEAWDHNLFGIGSGSAGDYLFKLVFIWVSIGVAIVSLKHGKWIPNLGAALRVVVLGFFSITVLIYALEHGVHGIVGGDLKPTGGVFLALVPLLLFNYVGFELQSGAAEEMHDPQKDVPKSVVGSAVIGVLCYAVPIFGIILVLPPEAITGIGGFIDAVSTVFSVYGGASGVLIDLMTLAFVGTLLTSGAVWMIGSDRIQAVAALDGGFPPYFGVFNARFGTPLRVNVLSGLVATAFMVVAVAAFDSGANATFGVVLAIAVSTTLISYLWIFTAAVRLRFTHPDVPRPYRVPFGNVGIVVCGALVTGWVALGSWVAVFPGTLERLFGLSYDFHETWGVSQGKYEALTLGTLGVIVVIAGLGYLSGHAARQQRVTPVPTG